MSQQRFDEIQAEIARELFSAVPEQAVLGFKWTEAFLEARFDPDGGGSNIVKFRIRLEDGKLFSLESPLRTTLLLDHLWTLRESSLANAWYGIRITVTPTGECTTEFDNDPDAMSRPGFFDD